MKQSTKNTKEVAKGIVPTVNNFLTPTKGGKRGNYIYYPTQRH